MSEDDTVSTSILSKYYIPPSHIKSVSVVAAGGGGQILRGYFDDEVIALKRTYGLMMGGLTDQESLKEFCHEAEIMVSLSHPNILRLYGVTIVRTDERCDGTPRSLSDVMLDCDWSNYELRMVCEMCRTSLQRVLNGDPQLSGSSARAITHRDSLSWSAQLASALSFLQYVRVRRTSTFNTRVLSPFPLTHTSPDRATHTHMSSSHEVLHLDVKPDNVLLDARMHVRLCDFGISSTLQKHDKARQYRRSLHSKRNAKECAYCRKVFGILRRKHQCSVCCKIVCSECTIRRRVAGRLLAQDVCSECDSLRNRAAGHALVHTGLGTPLFLSPEQHAAEVGDVLLHPKSIDIWAFGIVMWMMARRCCAPRAGIEPYGDRDPATIRAFVRSGGRPLPPPSRSPLAPYIAQCFHAKPQDRPSLDVLHHQISALVPAPSTDLSSIPESRPTEDGKEEDAWIRSPRRAARMLVPGRTSRPKSCPPGISMSPPMTMTRKTATPVVDVMSVVEERTEETKAPPPPSTPPVLPPSLPPGLSIADHAIAAPAHLVKEPSRWIREACLTRHGSIQLIHHIPHVVDRSRSDTPPLPLKMQPVTRRASLVTRKLERLPPSPRSARHVARMYRSALRLAVLRLLRLRDRFRRRDVARAWKRLRSHRRVKNTIASKIRRSFLYPSKAVTSTPPPKTRTTRSPPSAPPPPPPPPATTLALSRYVPHPSFVSLSGLPCEADLTLRFARKALRRTREAMRRQKLPPGLRLFDEAKDGAIRRHAHPRGDIPPSPSEAPPGAVSARAFECRRRTAGVRVYV
eukprot:g2512.t1